MAERDHEQHNDDEGIRARFKRLVAERSQSEIARRTDTGVAAVNRYVHGARIPAAFCAALVRGLGVNPAWLLMGEGAPYLADVHGDTVKLGENMLELVEAMSAASQMLLGSLTGQHHLKLLRELNDALLAHERLRERMNEQSRPVFERVLDQLQAAIKDIDMERATELVKAAQQVSRLCDDDALTDRLLDLNAAYEFHRKRPQNALAIERRRFLRTVMSSNAFTLEALRTGRQVAVSLAQSDRVPEALRVCRAVRALAGPELRTSDVWYSVENSYGLLLIEMGKLDRGLVIVRRCRPHLTGKIRTICEAHVLRGMLYGNAISVADAINIGSHNDAKAQFITRFATYSLDRDAIELAIEYSERPDLEPMYKSSAYLRLTRAVLAQLKAPSPERARQAAAEDLAPEDNAEPNVAFMAHAGICEVMRLSGARDEARAALRAATAALDEMMPEFLPQPNHYAMWARASLDLLRESLGRDDRMQRRRARSVLKRMVRHGYLAFQDALQPKP